MALAGAKEMSFERGRRIFLGPQHWEVLMEAADDYICKHLSQHHHRWSPEKSKAGIETLRLLVKANELKRFIVEVENGEEVMRVRKR
jgi:hypothetical protein